ncbi:ArfGap-domain-containing protein [Mytilinidion resinicola]|uniref:ArfGap-domain-containing protein n=1 Tax=Mytilinidion resinicola TaxID=574789 RepID=A0A6A6Y7M8_9PEZI|nr:ArfGap-domain-containing protein [Mytilinidion resinicola]KAF2804690.1 ArfGap-domain-containing protein [Mytilinidion resinicola]
MSRRPNPAADRAAQNTQTLKSLVKLEGNKSCADCKRNKHPRWASWNLGIFVCIRCSGIHRGMGTHISRVKSVDLDSWTDEQLQSMLRWGNSRANKYWEAKLAPGHVPSESKIENFIRTKYESKRWVMDGPMPDPATLETEGDDDVPLNVVQEKAKLERSSSQRAASAGNQSQSIQPPARRPQNVDLFGDDPTPPRPNTGPPISRAAPPKAAPAPPKQTRPADSLLGLDFFGGSQSAPPARPSSTTQATSSVPSRPDLKQSILSLYASAPKPPPQPQVHHGHSDSFGGLGGIGGMQSPPVQQQSSQQSQFGGMNDAFSNLNFNPPPAQQQPKPSAFSDLASFSSHRTTPQSTTSSAFGGGGSFFDTIPKSPPATTSIQKQRTFSSDGGFGDFSSMTKTTPAAAPKPAASSGMGDLFDLSMPSSTPAAAQKTTVVSPSTNMHSAFNLSAPAQPKPAPAPAAAPSYSGFSNMDAWGSTDAWATSNTTTTAPAHTVPKSPAWGAPANPVSPKISQDEDFGGWSSAAPAPAPARSGGSKPLGGIGGDDLFSNVWE